jgi:hypothetical protein
MLTTELTHLPDDALAQLDDALLVETERRRVTEAWETIRDLADEHLDALHDLVDEEVLAREERKLALHLAHQLEQGEAREQAGDRDCKKRFMHRAARLFKLAQLNAPDVILNEAIDMMLRVRPPV